MSDHAGFIAAAYAVAALVLGGTVAAVLMDGASLRRALARLGQRDARGDGDDG